jgi:hypothetical protein
VVLVDGSGTVLLPKQLCFIKMNWEVVCTGGAIVSILLCNDLVGKINGSWAESDLYTIWERGRGC